MNKEVCDVPVPSLSDDDRIYKVYSEYDFITNNLKHPRFTFTGMMEEADILWLSHHCKDYT